MTNIDSSLSILRAMRKMVQPFCQVWVFSFPMANQVNTCHEWGGSSINEYVIDWLNGWWRPTQWQAFQRAEKDNGWGSIMTANATVWPWQDMWLHPDKHTCTHIHAHKKKNIRHASTAAHNGQCLNTTTLNRSSAHVCQIKFSNI